MLYTCVTIKAKKSRGIGNTRSKIFGFKIRRLDDSSIHHPRAIEASAQIETYGLYFFALPAAIRGLHKLRKLYVASLPQALSTLPNQEKLDIVQVGL